jgi:hypothetical protein
MEGKQEDKNIDSRERRKLAESNKTDKKVIP